MNIPASVDPYISLDQQLWAALLAYDFATFANLLADDVMLVATDGVRRTKAEYIARLPQFTFGVCSQDNFVVQPIASNSAVVNYTAHISGTSKGEKLEATLSISSIWAERNGNWQIVFTQDALIS